LIIFNHDFAPESSLTMAPKKNARSVTPNPAAPVVQEPVAAPVSSHPAKTTSKGGRANWDEVLLNIYEYYMKDTPQRTKLIDVFLFFLAVVGGLQFLYCVLAGNYVCFHKGLTKTMWFSDVLNSLSTPSCRASALPLANLF
jgi:hypothetical protein